MRITCRVSNLVDALNALIRTMPPSGASRDLFKYVRILAHSERCILLSAANPLFEVAIEIEGEVEGCGCVCTPALPLTQCIEQAMSKGGRGAKVTLCDEGFAFTCMVNSGDVVSLERENASTISFQRAPAADLILELETLREAIEQVAFAGHSLYEGDQLACIWVQVEKEGKITFAASDRYCFAVRTMWARGGSRFTPLVFQIPSCAFVHVLSTLPKEGVVTLQVDQDQNRLYLDAGSVHAVAQLHVEWDRSVNYGFGAQVKYNTIPFLQLLPSRWTTMLKISRSRLKGMMGRDALQRMKFEKGKVLLESYRKGRKQKEEAIAVEVSGDPPDVIWFRGWKLKSVLSCACATKDLVLVIEDDVPAKLMVRWIVDGDVQECYSYVFLACDPYLALLETKMEKPLSDAARHVLEEQKRSRASLRESWLVKAVRESVLDRIFLLIECVGVPTERDIRRIVRDETDLGDSFAHLGRVRDKRERDRRFEWLVTQAAIWSFAQGGVTLRGLSLCEVLHIDAREILQDLQEKKAGED